MTLIKLLESEKKGFYGGVFYLNGLFKCDFCSKKFIRKNAPKGNKNDYCSKVCLIKARAFKRVK